MTRTFMCEYGNCAKDADAVTVTTHDRRVRFCCTDHAARYLLNEAARTEHQDWKFRADDVLPWGQ